MKKIRAPKWCGPTNPGRHYKPGESGNPKGRAPGSRNKISEAFFKDLPRASDEELWKLSHLIEPKNTPDAASLK